MTFQSFLARHGLHAQRAGAARGTSSKSCHPEAGFTLIELMIVISIILILIAIAVPVYNQSVIRAKEAVLRQDLKTMRDQIDNYTMDKEKGPQSLQELVDAGYLRSIPKDPFTNSADTWQVENSDTMQSLDQTEPGITDVHSGSNLTGSDGTAYSSW
jgi:general secretion pathway protein G